MWLFNALVGLFGARTRDGEGVDHPSSPVPEAVANRLFNPPVVTTTLHSAAFVSEGPAGNAPLQKPVANRLSSSPTAPAPHATGPMPEGPVQASSTGLPPRPVASNVSAFAARSSSIRGGSMSKGHSSRAFSSPYASSSPLPGPSPTPAMSPEDKALQDVEMENVEPSTQSTAPKFALSSSPSPFAGAKRSADESDIAEKPSNTAAFGGKPVSRLTLQPIRQVNRIRRTKERKVDSIIESQMNSMKHSSNEDDTARPPRNVASSAGLYERKKAQPAFQYNRKTLRAKIVPDLDVTMEAEDGTPPQQETHLCGYDGEHKLTCGHWVHDGSKQGSPGLPCGNNCAKQASGTAPFNCPWCRKIITDVLETDLHCTEKQWEQLRASKNVLGETLFGHLIGILFTSGKMTGCIRENRQSTANIRESVVSVLRPWLGRECQFSEGPYIPQFFKPEEWARIMLESSNREKFSKENATARGKKSKRNSPSVDEPKAKRMMASIPADLGEPKWETRPTVGDIVRKRSFDGDADGDADGSPTRVKRFMSARLKQSGPARFAFPRSTVGSPKIRKRGVDDELPGAKKRKMTHIEVHEEGVNDEAL